MPVCCVAQTDALIQVRGDTGFAAAVTQPTNPGAPGSGINCAQPLILWLTSYTVSVNSTSWAAAGQSFCVFSCCKSAVTSPHPPTPLLLSSYRSAPSGACLLSGPPSPSPTVWTLSSSATKSLPWRRARWVDRGTGSLLVAIRHGEVLRTSAATQHSVDGTHPHAMSHAVFDAANLLNVCR